MPFFTYYGGKHRATKFYPRPVKNRIIEPFAGSAGYSLNYPDHEVILLDKDPVIVSTWRYLIDATEEEILSLPDLNIDQTVDDLDIPEGAKYLIGWWLNKGSAQPKKRPSTFAALYPEGGPYWGNRVRNRIASQLPFIRHWVIEQGSYESLSANIEATWFIDPPYIEAGKHYRHGSSGIDYEQLSEWCRSRSGQVIVCEADGASWLPFRPLIEIDGTEGVQKVKRARMEMIYP